MPRALLATPGKRRKAPMYAAFLFGKIRWDLGLYLTKKDALEQARIAGLMIDRRDLRGGTEVSTRRVWISTE